MKSKRTKSKSKAKAAAIYEGVEAEFVRGKTPKEKHQDAFLAAFVACGTISGACDRAGLERSAFYAWRENDTDFVKRFDECDIAITESIEGKAVEMARGGEMPMISFILKARRPDVYREKHDVKIEGSLPLTIILGEAAGMPDDAPATNANAPAAHG